MPYEMAANLAAVAIPAAAIVITVIKTRGLSQSAIRPEDRHETPMTCMEHTGLVTELRNLKEGQERIEDSMIKKFDKVFEKLDIKIQ